MKKRGTNKLWKRLTGVACAGVLVAATILASPGLGDLLNGGTVKAANTDGLDGTYCIRNLKTGKYLDVAGYSRENGGNIYQWNYTGASNQQFRLVSDGNGYYSIFTGITDFTKSVDVEGWGRNDGTNIEQWEYHGGDCQKFSFDNVGGAYVIRTKVTGESKCLDVEGPSDAIGTNVHQWNYYGGDNQKWVLERVDGGHSPGTFTNPISYGEAADPYVQYYNGYYYALYTEGFQISICRSRSLDRVLKDERKVIYRVGGEVKGNIWAPELHYISATNQWYIYASGSTNGDDFGSIRMFCLESRGSDPYGDYTFAGFTDSNRLAIDETVFFDEKTGTLYTAFSEFTGDGQVITFAKMDGPAKVSDRRIRLSKPEFDWETRGATPGKDSRVNEGPIFLLHNGKLVLIYSASGCWSEWYCLGMVEYIGPDFSENNMLNPANWVKHSAPIFQEGNNVYGVGHCSFFNSPDGRETWIAYHGMSTPGAGESGRFMYAQPISFNNANLPVIGAPIPRGQSINLPTE